MNERIKVSIIIATYNTENYINECLDSILNQSLEEIEIIVIDDGSTDNTGEILKSYRDQRIKYYKQENTGAGIARNHGIDISKGEYLFFMDPDDRFPLEDCIEKLYSAAKKNNAELCGGNIIGEKNGQRKKVYEAGDGDVNKTKNGFINNTDYYHLYSHTRFLYSAQMIKDNNVVFGPYKRFEDQVFTIKAIYYAKKFYELDYPVYLYRIQSYKDFDEDIWIDILRGQRDTVKMLYDYDLKPMIEKNIDNLIGKMASVIIRHSFQSNKNVIGIIDDVDSLIRKVDPALIPIKERIQSAVRLKESIEHELADNRVIVYGAGSNTRRLLDVFGAEYRNRILGIAVSDMRDNHDDYLDGIRVNQIETYERYKDIALVIITPGERARNDIEEKLTDLGYSRYLWVDMKLV